jgi:hypothetical protein
MGLAQHEILTAAFEREETHQREGVGIAFTVVGDRIAPHQAVIREDLLIDADIALAELLF